MKKNDWILLSTTGIYSFLFYGESLGLNLSIFTVICCIGLALLQPTLLKNRNWLMVGFGTLISAAAVTYFGNAFSIFTNCTSLLLLVGMTMNRKTSVLFAFMYGIVTLAMAPYSIVNDAINRKLASAVDVVKLRRKVIIVFVPIVITLLFFLMYKNSNPLFKAYADKINFNWISFGWIFFTLTGMTLIYGILKPKRISILASIDEIESLDIRREESKEFKILGRTIGLVDEYFSGKLLFILLNILIGIVNLLDINFVFISKVLPDGLTYSQVIHQGVGMLVVSILISIVIVLFYFRGEMNFYSKNKAFKMLAYLWLIQNMFMLVSVCMKNNLYIENYGLTYKRIGIYVYTLLTFIGLLTTLLKIYKVKINLYLLRINGWVFYSVLITASLFNWDNVIIDYNQKNKHDLDIYYTMSFSNNTLPKLIFLESKIKQPIKRAIFHHKLLYKINDFHLANKNTSWKSFNYTDSKVKAYLDKHHHDFQPKIERCDDVVSRY